MATLKSKSRDKKASTVSKRPSQTRRAGSLVRKIRLPAARCSNPLAFTMQPQQQTQWCWAAVAVSVDLYYHTASRWTQCKLANAALGQTTCCANGSSLQCNQPWYLNKALQIVANLASSNAGKASLAAVQAEVKSCRPLALRIGWDGGGGHFVAVYGYSGNNINIADPWYGNSIQSHALFPTAYQGGGTWTHNYYTKA